MQKPQNNFAFIDAQNLHLSILNAGWELDYGSLRKYLWDKYSIRKAFLFIGYIPEHQKLYTSLQEKGYVLVFKPTLQNKSGFIKGNCDAELVLHCMIEYKNFDKAVIISGDGDFYCLIEYLSKNSKLLKVGIPNSHKYSALLRKFQPYLFFIDFLKRKLIYKKKEAS